MAIDAHSNTSSDKVDTTNHDLKGEKGVETDAYASQLDEDGQALAANPFLDPDVAAHWTEVYNRCEYESRHAFDPHYTWTDKEESRALLKVDLHVCLWASVMFFALQVDRGNLVQAVSGTMLRDLRMTTDDYNFGNTVFLFSWLLSELPCQLISKKVGPDWFIPFQMTAWSVVAISQCAMHSKKSYFALRSLLGIFQGGFVPDIVLWLSYFYTSREMPKRLAVFYATLNMTTIVTSLLAFAIFHLNHKNGWNGWRWLFLIEGLITLTVGLCSWFMMPAGVTQTRAWYRPNGWFTEHEEKIIVNKVLRDDPSKGDMNNRQGVTPKGLWSAAKDYDLWPVYAIGCLAYIPTLPPAFYITITLRLLGFSTFHANLLTIPPAVGHIITILCITWLSERLNERALISSIQPIWVLPCIIALRYWSGAEKNHWGTYACTVVLLAYPYVIAIQVGWVSKNSNDVGARAVSAAFYNMCAQVSALSATYIYATPDAPLYHKGNEHLIIIDVVVIFMMWGAKAYYVWRNKQKARVWNSMTAEEQRDYILNTSLTGSRRLDFQFAH